MSDPLHNEVMELAAQMEIAKLRAERDALQAKVDAIDALTEVRSDGISRDVQAILHPEGDTPT